MEINSDYEKFIKFNNILGEAIKDIASFFKNMKKTLGNNFVLYNNWNNYYKEIILIIDKNLVNNIEYLLNSAKMPFKRGEKRWNIYTWLVKIRDIFLEKIPDRQEKIMIKEVFKNVKNRYKYLVKYGNFFNLIEDISVLFIDKMENFEEIRDYDDYFLFLYNYNGLGEILKSYKNKKLQKLINCHKSKKKKKSCEDLPLSFPDWMNLLKENINYDFYLIYEKIHKGLDDYNPKDDRRYYQNFLAIFPKIIHNTFTYLEKE